MAGGSWHRDALRRIARKAGSVAERVVYITMPLQPRLESEAEEQFPLVRHLETIIGDSWLRFTPGSWNYREGDFFGAMGSDACHFDWSHLNPAASSRFSRRLAAAIGLWRPGPTISVRQP